MHAQPSITGCIRQLMSAAVLFAFAAGGIAPATAAPVIQLTKTPDGAVAAPGDPIRFTYTITNIGDEDADFPQLTDPLPGAGIMRWRTDIRQDDNASCTFNTDPADGRQIFVCDFDVLPPGEHFTAFVFATGGAVPVGFRWLQELLPMSYAMSPSPLEPSPSFR